jgi:hypothetical protein
MAAAADVFARRFFEILQPITGISARCTWLRIKRPLSKRSGPRVMGGWPNSRQSSMLLPAVRSRRSPISMPTTLNLWKEVVCSILYSVGFFPREWPPACGTGVCEEKG